MSVSGKCQNEQFFSYIMARTNPIQWDDDDVRFVLDQQASSKDFCISLTQHSPGKHVAPLWHIILNVVQLHISLHLFLDVACLVKKQQITMS